MWGDLCFDSLWIPELFIGMNYSWSINRGVYSKLRFEDPVMSIEAHRFNITLSTLDIGSGQDFYFFLLERTVLVIESFGAGSSSCGEILHRLEVPVGPTSQMVITSISHLSNLSYTRLKISACTKLTHDQRNTKSISIFAPS